MCVFISSQRWSIVHVVIQRVEIYQFIHPTKPPNQETMPTTDPPPVSVLEPEPHSFRCYGLIGDHVKLWLYSRCGPLAADSSIPKACEIRPLLLNLSHLYMQALSGDFEDVCLCRILTWPFWLINVFLWTIVSHAKSPDSLACQRGNGCRHREQQPTIHGYLPPCQLPEWPTGQSWTKD